MVTQSQMRTGINTCRFQVFTPYFRLGPTDRLKPIGSGTASLAYQSC